jgi:hypothetical protein
MQRETPTDVAWPVLCPSQHLSWRHAKYQLVMRPDHSAGILTGSGAHHASYSMGTAASSPEVKQLATHLHLEQI